MAPFLASGVPALLAATTIIVAVDLPTDYDIPGYRPPFDADVARSLAFWVLVLAPPLVGLVMGWRLGILAVFAALVGQAVGIFGAFDIGDSLAKMLEPRSFQLFEAAEGMVGVGIVFLGWFVGLPVIAATGAVSWWVRRERSRKPVSALELPDWVRADQPPRRG